MTQKMQVEETSVNDAEAERPGDKRNTEIEDLKAKAEENWQKLLREKADMQNLQTRTKREVEDAHKFGATQVIKQILPVIDSLERSLETKHPEIADSAVLKAMHEGMELTLKMVLDVLTKSAVQQINPLGQGFDPQLHEAMSVQEDASAAPNTVLAVVQKGYSLHGRVLRPALVVVNKA
jgi:molecular chaperone GrpE